MINIINSLQDFITFPFLQHALLGVIALSITTGTLSPIIISKRYSFMGAAIAHSSLLGVAISLLLPISNPAIHFLSTLAITLIASLFLAYSAQSKELPSDSLIGIFFSVMMALGILIFSLNPQNSENLLSFLFGNILLLTNFDLLILMIITLVVLFIIFAFLRYWMLFIIDPVEAQLEKLPTALMHYALFVLITITIVTAIKLAGTILVTTLLIIPGIAGIRLARSGRQVFILSIIFSLMSSILGLFVANALNSAPGATLAIVQFIILMLILKTV